MKRKSKEIGQKYVEPLSFKNAPEFLNPRQVQELLQISRSTFLRMVKEKNLAGAVKIGKSWRVNRDKLKAWLDENMQKG